MQPWRMSFITLSKHPLHLWFKNIEINDIAHMFWNRERCVCLLQSLADPSALAYHFVDEPRIGEMKISGWHFSKSESQLFVHLNFGKWQCWEMMSVVAGRTSKLSLCFVRRSTVLSCMSSEWVPCPCGCKEPLWNVSRGNVRSTQ